MVLVALIAQLRSMNTPVMKRNANTVIHQIMVLAVYIAQPRNTDMVAELTNVVGVVLPMLDRDAHIVLRSITRNRRATKWLTKSAQNYIQR